MRSKVKTIALALLQIFNVDSGDIDGFASEMVNPIEALSKWMTFDIVCIPAMLVSLLKLW